MGKRFKGKTCVYCAVPGASTTGDHVFAREFFPLDQRDGLPVVPACQPCNQQKSVLEHYLATVMPFGGRHPASSALLNEAVPKRLAKNQKLHRRLTHGFSDITTIENGAPVETFAVPFDGDKMIALFAMIARALTWHHWNAIIPPAYPVSATLLNPCFEPIMREIFLRPRRAHAQGELADGLFRYEGALSSDDPPLTMWRFQVYGGLVLGGDPHVPEPAALTVWAAAARGVDFFHDPRGRELFFAAARTAEAAASSSE